jgi:hypothetical protein
LRFKTAGFSNRTRVITLEGEHVPGKVLVRVDDECHIVKERPAWSGTLFGLIFSRSFRRFRIWFVVRLAVFSSQKFEVFVSVGGRVDLAETETNAVLVGINADDAQTLDFAFLEGFLRMLDAVIGDLGDVDQAFDIAFEAGKGAEFGQAGDDTFDQLTNAIFLDAGAPGVFLQGADGKPDAFLFTINVDNFDLDFLPHFKHFTRMRDVIPGEFREMHEAIGAIDIDERAKISKAGDTTGVGLAFFQFFEHAFLDGLAGLGAGGAL